MADDDVKETESSFEVRGPAVVCWEAQGGNTLRYLHPDPANKRVMLEVCLDRSACFFRLRVPVRLKALDNTYLYFHIPPDHISSLEWTLDYDAPGLVRQQLNGNVTRLHFRLRTPGKLVVPAQQSLEPRKPATARAIEALISLAAIDALSVHVEHTALSKPRLECLETAIKSGASSSPARYLDLRSLYNGTGGRYSVTSVDENAISTASDEDVASPAAADSPPPCYDEIGEGPPMPPILEVDKPGKRCRRSSGSSSSSVGSTSRPLKRVTHDRDVKGALEASVSLAEQAVNPEPGPEAGPEPSSESGLLARLEALIKNQQGTIQMQQEAIAQLKETVAGLESRMAEMQERLDETGEQVDYLDVNVCELGQSVDGLENLVPDIDGLHEEALRKVNEEVREQVEEKVQDISEIMSQIITIVRAELAPSSEGSVAVCQGGDRDRPPISEMQAWRWLGLSRHDRSARQAWMGLPSDWRRGVHPTATSSLHGLVPLALPNAAIRAPSTRDSVDLHRSVFKR